MSGYRDGTVSITNGTKSVVGVSTAWVSQVKSEDLISFDDGGKFYEVDVVTDNTHLSIKTNFAGTTITAGTYWIARVSRQWQSTTDVAAQVAEVLLRASHVLRGTTPPANTLGIDNDVYFDTALSKFHIKTAGVWDGGTSMIGVGISGPSTSTDKGLAGYSGTAGNAIIDTGIIELTPRMFNAVMDGSADETAHVLNTISVAAGLNGRARIVIPGPIKITAALPVTASNIEWDFRGNGKFIIADHASTGPADFSLGVIKVGALTALSGRATAAAVTRNDRVITLNSVTGLTVGNLICFDWLYSGSFDNGFAAQILAINTGTGAVTLSHPIPYSIPNGKALSYCATGAPVQNMRMNGLCMEKGSYTGNGIVGVNYLCALNCTSHRSRTTGLKGGAFTSQCMVKVDITKHRGVNDGGPGAGGDSAFPIFRATDCCFEIDLSESIYFPATFKSAHHCTWLDNKVNGGGNLADTSASGFARAWKTWGCSDGNVFGLKCKRVVGVGPFFEARTQYMKFFGVESHVIKHNTAAAQGLGLNGMENNYNQFYGLVIKGTDTASGGSDIAIGATDIGNVFYGADYDTIINNEPNTTTIFRSNGQVLGPNATSGGVNPNLLVNGDFQINQRAFAGGALSSGVYGYDRWKASGAANVSVSGFTVTLTSGAIAQPIESALWGVANFASTTFTVSVESPSADVAVGLGSVNGIITAGSGRRSVTLTTGAGDTGNLIFTINKSTAGTVTFERIKLELGSASTAWQPRSLGDELVLAKRYWQKVGGEAAGDIHVRSAAMGQTYLIASIQIPVEMRITPTGAVGGSWDIVNSADTSPGLFTATKKAIRLAIFTSNATGTVADTYFASGTAGGYVTLTAEM